MNRNQIAQELLPEYLNAVPLALLLLDERQQIVSVNSETERLLGYVAHELSNQSIEIIFPACLCQIRDASRLVLIGNAASPGPVTLSDLDGIDKCGARMSVELRLNRIEQNGLGQVLCAIINTTVHENAYRQWAKQVQELTQENKRLDLELNEFTYVVSHDLQEPLRKVKSSCQALLEDHSEQLDVPARRWISFAVEAAQRMQQMLGDLLTCSRIATKTQSFCMINVADVVQTALNGLQAEIDACSVRVNVLSLPKVMADEAHLVMLFELLVSNAVKYRQAIDPFIEVGCRPATSGLSGEMIFFVRDNGIGILPEHCERIFVVFQRLHRRDQYSGTGIGLALCKKIVSRHRGKIWVESTVGEGSTFSFTLGSE